MDTKPIYSIVTCQPSFKLYWTLSIFWRANTVPANNWLKTLKQLTEKDGVRILEYNLTDNRVSQFLLSTRPGLSPSNIIRSVKGRLQYQIREIIPKAFINNYSIKSIGSVRHDIIQEYLNKQLEHHKLTDAAVIEKLQKYQFDNPEINLNSIRRSAHGQFIYNLHLVFVYAERYREIRSNRLEKSCEIIQRTALKKNHLLSKVSFLPDHIHMTLGCDVKEAPIDVVLGYMNNISYGYKQAPIFQNSFYIGTFGEYDLGAVRQIIYKKS